MCAIIFASQTLSFEERLGIDIFAPMPTTEEANSMFGGPRCMFQGSEIPCYNGPSPKGTNIYELLTDMLQQIDRSGVFPRLSNQRTPFLLLDGHGSRLEL